MDSHFLNAYGIFSRLSSAGAMVHPAELPARSYTTIRSNEELRKCCINKLMPGRNAQNNGAAPPLLQCHFESKAELCLG